MRVWDDGDKSRPPGNKNAVPPPPFFFLVPLPFLPRRPPLTKDERLDPKFTGLPPPLGINPKRPSTDVLDPVRQAAKSAVRPPIIGTIPRPNPTKSKGDGSRIASANASTLPGGRGGNLFWNTLSQSQKKDLISGIRPLGPNRGPGITIAELDKRVAAGSKS